MLCQTCKDCFFQEKLADTDTLEWKAHQNSVEDLEHGAREACYVCYIVWNSLSDAYRLQWRNQIPPFVPTLYRIRDNAGLSSSLTRESRVVQIICQVAEGRDVASRMFLLISCKGVASTGENRPTLGSCSPAARKKSLTSTPVQRYRTSAEP